jgi:protease-4
MGKLFRGLWAILSGISRFISVVVPLLFVGFLIFVISQGMKEAKPRPVPDATALMINPKGVLVEDRSAKEPIEALMAESENREILLSNLIRAIEEGAEDERVKVLVLDLQQLAGPSTSQAMEISKALETFRATGKPVVAVGDFYSQGQYLLAAQADHVPAASPRHCDAAGLRGIPQLSARVPRQHHGEHARIPGGREQIGRRALPSR